MDAGLPRRGGGEHFRLRHLLRRVASVEVDRLNTQEPERRAEVLSVLLDDRRLVKRHLEGKGRRALLLGLIAHLRRELGDLLSLVERVELRVRLEHWHHLFVDGLRGRVEVREQQLENEHLPAREGARQVQVDLVRLGSLRPFALLVLVDHGGRERVRQAEEVLPRRADLGILLPRRRPSGANHAAFPANDLPYLLAPVRSDRRHHQRLPLAPLLNQLLERADLRRAGPVLVPRILHAVESRLQGLTEADGAVALGREVQEADHLVLKPCVEPDLRRALRAELRVLARARERAGKPLHLGGERQDGPVCDHSVVVGVVGAVAGVGAGEARRVGAPLFDGAAQGDEVALRLGHLLRVDLHMPVAEEATGPHLWPVGPHGSVVVQRHRQVVRYEILARDAQVHRVPELDLTLELLDKLLLQSERWVVRLAKHDAVPEGLGALLGRDLRRPRLLPVQVAALQQVSDEVVRHVDGRVGERLDQKRLVPRHARAEAKGARARPVAEPRKRLPEKLVHSRVKALEVLLEVLAHRSLPGLLAVLEVPLIDERDDALDVGRRPRRHEVLGLEVGDRLALFDHLLLSLHLGLLDGHADKGPRRHHALVEARRVARVVRLLELLDVLLRLHLELLAHELGGERAEIRCLEHGHQLEGIDPLVLDAVKLALLWVLEVHEGGVVVRRVGGDRGDNRRALGHRDGRERQHVDAVVWGERRFDGGAEHLLALEGEQQLWLAPLREDVLEGHVPRSARGAQVDDRRRDLVRAVGALGQDPGVGLAAHGLRTQRAREREDLLACQRREHLWQRLEHAHLDGGVLLRIDALALVAVVVHARLLVSLGKDGRALAKSDEVALAELLELPADELVVVRVEVRRDEGTAPVDAQTEALKVLHSLGREVGQPVRWINEVDRLLGSDAHGAENVPLRHEPAGLRGNLGLDALLGAAASLLVLRVVLLWREQQQVLLAVGGLAQHAALHARRALDHRLDLECVLRADAEPADGVTVLAVFSLCGGDLGGDAPRGVVGARAHEHLEAAEGLAASAGGRAPPNRDGAALRVHPILQHLRRRWREIRKRLPVRLVLVLELVRSGLDGHAGAVKAEREENFAALQPIK
mmetsp:Transcript_18069/g.38960  ORF Transcript_18069/g.38960 Transcript_18069/m.38960 type:complete len:1101 (-) Transcript_18069:274-3576(-)